MNRDERATLPSLASIIEAILFASDRPVTVEELRASIPEAEEDALLDALEELGREYRESAGRGVALQDVAGGYLLTSRPEAGVYVERFLVGKRRARLSRAALETLATIAYRQPITRGEIEDLRGVDCGHVLSRLLERDLVTVRGRSEALGRPLLYGTTTEFLRYFGIGALSDLPALEEFEALASENPLDDPEIREALESQGLWSADDEEEAGRDPLIVIDDVPNREEQDAAGGLADDDGVGCEHGGGSGDAHAAIAAASQDAVPDPAGSGGNGDGVEHELSPVLSGGFGNGHGNGHVHAENGGNGHGNGHVHAENGGNGHGNGHVHAENGGHGHGNGHVHAENGENGGNGHSVADGNGGHETTRRGRRAAAAEESGGDDVRTEVERAAARTFSPETAVSAELEAPSFADEDELEVELDEAEIWAPVDEPEPVAEGEDEAGR